MGIAMDPLVDRFSCYLLISHNQLDGNLHRFSGYNQLRWMKIMISHNQLDGNGMPKLPRAEN